MLSLAMKIGSTVVNYFLSAFIKIVEVTQKTEHGREGTCRIHEGIENQVKQKSQKNTGNKKRGQERRIRKGRKVKMKIRRKEFGLCWYFRENFDF